MTGYLEAEYADTKRSKFPKALMKFLETKLDMDKVFSVVDAGAGTGDYLHAWGPSRQLMAFDRERGIRRQYLFGWTQWGFDLPLPNWPDLVISKSVIEHMTDPVGFVKLIAGPDRQIVIMCPDFETCYLDFYDDPTHVSPMTLRGLEQAVVMAGYKVNSSGRFAQTAFLVNKPRLAALFRLLIPKRFGRWMLHSFGVDWFRRASQLACYVVIKT